MKNLITEGFAFIGSQIVIKLIKGFKTIKIIIVDNIYSGKISSTPSINQFRRRG